VGQPQTTQQLAPPVQGMQGMGMMPFYEDNPLTCGSAGYCFISFLCFASLVTILGIGIEYDLVREDIFQRMDNNHEITKNSVELQRLIIWDGATDAQLEHLLLYHKEMYKLALISAFTRNDKMKDIFAYQVAQAQKKGDQEEVDRILRDHALYENRLTPAPSKAPSIPPSSAPSSAPTLVPSVSPSSSPSASPRPPITRSPTGSPSAGTEAPMCAPCVCPSCSPSAAPLAPTDSPTDAPLAPTGSPSTPPSATPSNATGTPTAHPTGVESPQPTAVQTDSPTVVESDKRHAKELQDTFVQTPSSAPSSATSPPTKRAPDNEVDLAPVYVHAAEDFNYPKYHNNKNINSTLAIVGCVSRQVRLSGGNICRRLDADEMIWFIGRVRTFRYVLWSLAVVGFLVWLSLVYAVANPFAQEAIEHTQHAGAERACCYINPKDSDERKEAMKSAFPEQRACNLNASNYRYFGQMFGAQAAPGMTSMRKKGSNLRVVLGYGWACASTALFPVICREMFYFWEVIDWYKGNTTGDLQKFWNDFYDTSLGCNLWLIIFVCWPMWWFIVKISLWPLGAALYCCMSGAAMGGVQETQTLPMAGNQAKSDPGERGEPGSSEALENWYMYPMDLLRFGFMDYRLWGFAVKENTILRQDQVGGFAPPPSMAVQQQQQPRDVEEPPEPTYNHASYQHALGLSMSLWGLMSIESKRHLEILVAEATKNGDFGGAKRFLMGNDFETDCTIPPAVSQKMRELHQTPSSWQQETSAPGLHSMKPAGQETPLGTTMSSTLTRNIVREEKPVSREVPDFPRRPSSTRQETTESDVEMRPSKKKPASGSKKKVKSKRSSTAGRDRSDPEGSETEGSPSRRLEKKSSRSAPLRKKSSRKKKKDTSGGSGSERERPRRTKAKSSSKRKDTADPEQ